MDKVAGIVLAAGRSTRLTGEGSGTDRPKQLLEIDGEPLVRRVTLAALGARLEPVVVVVGHAADEVAAAVDGLGVRVVRNPEYRDGQSASVQAGLMSLPADVGAAVFLLADQPWLTSDTVGRLAAAWRERGAPIVAPAHRGRRAAPVLFGRPLFAELAALRGDVGGRALLPRHADRIVTLEVDDARELADVDTLEDLHAWTER